MTGSASDRLSTLVSESQASAGHLLRLASAVQSLHDFGLSRNQDVQLEALLSDGMREVSERIREVLDVGVGAAASGAAGGTVGSERVIEPRVDVHASPSGGGPGAGTPDLTVDATVGGAGDLPSGAGAAEGGSMASSAAEGSARPGDRS